MPNTIQTLPADLPQNWTRGQVVAPDGAAVGLTEQHGFNYLCKQVNDAQRVINEQAALIQELREELSNKVNTSDFFTTPKWAHVPLVNGTTISQTNEAFKYCKIGSVVYLRGAVVFSQQTQYVFAQLPEGYRGICLASSISSAVGDAPALMLVRTDGELVLHGTYPGMTLREGAAHHFCASFVASH